MTNIIVVIGKPGAGKDTRLSEFLKGREESFVMFSAGNILRKEISDGTQLGKEVQQYMDNGEMVPDDVVNEIALNAIKNADKTVLLNGYPRTVEQARVMLEAGIVPIKVIDLFVEDSVIIQRAKDRMVCGKCNETYTTNNFKKPKKDGVCDKCGGALIKRKDDAPEVVANRLKVFDTETYPVIEFLKDRKVYVETLFGDSDTIAEEFADAIEN